MFKVILTAGCVTTDNWQQPLTQHINLRIEPRREHAKEYFFTIGYVAYKQIVA